MLSPREGYVVAKRPLLSASSLGGNCSDLNSRTYSNWSVMLEGATKGREWRGESGGFRVTFFSELLAVDVDVFYRCAGIVLHGSVSATTALVVGQHELHSSPSPVHLCMCTCIMIAIAIYLRCHLLVAVRTNEIE